MSIIQSGLISSSLINDGLIRSSLIGEGGADPFEELQNLSEPLVVAYEGNNPLETGRYPQPTTVLNLDGSSQYVDLNSNSICNFIHETLVFKVCGHVKLTDYTADKLSPIIGSNGASSANQGFVLSYDNRSGVGAPSTFRLNVSNGGSAVVGGLFNAGSITDNLWHFIELIGNGSQVECFVDGVSIGSLAKTGAFGSGNSTFNVSYGWEGTGLYLGGLISTFSIYDSSDESSLVVSHPLNQTSGTVALDRAGDNHGTLMNGASWVVDNTLPWQADVTNEEGFSVNTAYSYPVNHQGSSPYDNFTAVGLDGFDAVLTSGVGIAGWNLPSMVSSGDVLRIQLEADFDESPSCQLRASSSVTSSASDAVLLTSGSNDFELTATSNSSTMFLSISEGDSPSFVNIRKLRIEVVSGGSQDQRVIPPSTIDQTKDCLGNDLQFSGSVYPVIPVPEGSSALSFDGSADYADTGIIPDETTIFEVRGRFIDDTSNQFMGAGRDAQSQAFLFGTGSTEFYASYYSANGNTGIAKDTEVHDFKIVANGDSATFWVDDESFLMPSGSKVPFADSLFIGARGISVGVDNFCNFEYHHVKITKGGTVVCEYDFTETSGTTVFDTSGNDNHGTLVNGPTWVNTRDGYGTNLNQLRGFSKYVNESTTVRVPYANGSPLVDRPADAVDENLRFEVDTSDVSDWILSNSVFSPDSGAGYANFYATAGPTNAGIAELTASIPSSGDYIWYMKMGGSSVSGSSVTAQVGGAGDGRVAASLGYNWETSSYEQNRVSAYVRRGGSVHGIQGPLIDYSITPVEIALQYDDRLGVVNFFVKESGIWEFYGGEVVDDPHENMLRIFTGGGGASDLDLYHTSFHKPNFVSIGDSICAGHNHYDPDPSYYAGDDDHENSWQHWAGNSSLRNNLIINYGVGSQNSLVIKDRTASMLANTEASVVYLHASTNDYGAGFTNEQRTTYIQDTVDLITGSGASCIMLNAIYPNSGSGNYPDNGDFYRSWWEGYSETITGVSRLVDIMDTLKDGTGYIDSSFAESDGVHPNKSGYKRIAALFNPVPGYVFTAEHPAITYGHNDSENTENGYNLCEDGSVPSAAVNLGNFNLINFSDTRLDLIGTIPTYTAFRRHVSSVAKDRLIIFHDTLPAGSERNKAITYTNPLEDGTEDPWFDESGVVWEDQAGSLWYNL